ncbi:MAG: ATP-binding protein [Melioribacteraceae bacterium]|nr:ATP-binding protein [Melioribacteraceae bacterium]MCF8354852.1 ATP-binding protein [Melioribacteraceae bacterium]MCF8392959.1 ATP-binding protein [Melioribacteraceae bacterium]MCF8417298.1 ATP-binding protein [Melioribacteraceae bacterium]
MKENFAEIEKSLIELRDGKLTALDKFTKLVSQDLNIPIILYEPINLIKSVNRNTDLMMLSFYLYRLIINCSDCIWTDRALRVEIFKLLNNSLSAIFNKAGVHENDNLLTQLQKLVQFDRKLLESFGFPDENFHDINNIKRYMGHVLRNLKEYSAAALIQCHPKQELFNIDRIQDFFNDVISVLSSKSSEGSDRIQAISDVHSKLNDLLKSIEMMNSPYLKKLFSKELNKIKDLVEGAEEYKKVSKKALLELNYAKNRKFPLHLIKKNFYIKFIIENKGEGIAINCRLKLETKSKEIKILSESIPFGKVLPGSRIEYNIEIIVRRKVKKDPELNVILMWENYQGKLFNDIRSIRLEAQREDINWEKIKFQKPYSLSFVEEEHELIGRAEILDNLMRKFGDLPLESCIITGQKRVGKTSLAKILEKRIKNYDDNTITCYSMVGEHRKTSAAEFIDSLTNKIVEQIINHNLVSDTKTELPKLDATLIPLINFIKRLVEENSQIKFVIFIDEFDEIPSDLYEYNQTSDSFFHNLRSIADNKNVAFVLIGGENMIQLHQTTDRINQFTTFQVTYFDKENYWKDFCSLVTKPIKDFNLEFSPNAIDLVYQYSEGNPFYTKFICREIFNYICTQKISYIHSDEAIDGINKTLSVLDLQNINHIWKDGLIAKSNEAGKRDTIETQRRRFLIDFAFVKRKYNLVNKALLTEAPNFTQYNADRLIQEFCRRGFVNQQQNGNLSIKPHFIEKFLVNQGYNKISAEFLNDEEVLAFQRVKENLYVNDDEIYTLVNKWGPYRAKKISLQKVRSWLSLFEDNEERRLAFKLISKINFYDEQKMRQKLKDIHDMIKRDSLTRVEKGRIKSLLISTFGKINKSGSSLTRMYQSENQIYSDNIQSANKLMDQIKRNSKIKTLCFIDDIIGSGQTIIEGIDEIFTTEFCQIVKSSDIKIYIASICAFERGMKSIEEYIEHKELLNDLKSKINVITQDYILESDKAFSEENEIFENVSEMRRAESIMKKYGEKLIKNAPLGRNDNQLLIVFADNCPNNTLPIIHKKTKNWMPLFERIQS